MLSKITTSYQIYNLENIAVNPVFFLISLISVYIFYKWREGPYYTKPYRLDGEVVIVTGCNRGIGKEIALDMAHRGARVYMGCRNYQKCETARQEIISATQNQNVFNCSLDLSCMKSVRNFVYDFQQKENHLDILINNAGILATPHTLTQDGFELQFAVNHLGHFLLTNLLLDHLKLASKSRIVVLSSIAHLIGHINKQDLHGLKNYSKIGAYAQSKLANILFTRHLTKLLKGSSTTVNCLHPGVVRTNIFKQDTLIRVGAFLVSILFRSVKSGAQTALYLAIDPEIEGKSGHYYANMKVAYLAPEARDDDLAESLWKESERLVCLTKRNS